MSYFIKAYQWEFLCKVEHTETKKEAEEIATKWRLIYPEVIIEKN